MSALVVTGGTSFLGRALLATLPEGMFSELRLLIHRQRPSALPSQSRVTTIVGDLLRPDTLRELIVPGSTVIHLAYLGRPHAIEENTAAAINLIAACRNARIRRLVHCSTAAVTGTVADNLITEETKCNPIIDYERVKYRIEQEMLAAAAGRHEITILRPTLAFGPDGRNLLALAQRIRSGTSITRFAYSALQGRRRMNLVSARNVAAALGFLAAANRMVDAQTYIISDDNDPLNNYYDVARILGRELCGWQPSRVMLPAIVLASVLKARGRSNSNPNRIYSDDKLRSAGFAKPWAFDTALVDFARWFRMQNETPASTR